MQTDTIDAQQPVSWFDGALSERQEIRSTEKSSLKDLAFYSKTPLKVNKDPWLLELE